MTDLIAPLRGVAGELVGRSVLILQCVATVRAAEAAFDRRLACRATRRLAHAAAGLART